MLEIIEKCREAKSSEVKSLKLSERSKVKWNEVKCSIRKGGNESLWKRFIG